MVLFVVLLARLRVARCVCFGFELCGAVMVCFVGLSFGWLLVNSVVVRAFFVFVMNFVVFGGNYCLVFNLRWVFDDCLMVLYGGLV